MSEQQTLKLGAKILEIIPSCDLDSKEKQDWIENPKKLRNFLLGLKPKYLSEFQSLDLSKYSDDIPKYSEHDEAFKLCEFFFTRKGLWVHNEFHMGFRPRGGYIEPIPETTISYADILLPVKENKARSLIPPCIPLRETKMFPVCLAGMLESQSKGENGFLTTVHKNIFCVDNPSVGGWVAYISWVPDACEWRLEGGFSHGGHLNKGDRVFSRIWVT